jgi:protein-S-isoprenylcysteine O-methyltransferase Ste14
LFAVLGVIGITLTYLSAREEDKRLVEKFGDDYIAYMRMVPRMNVFLGVIRLIQHRRQRYNAKA